MKKFIEEFKTFVMRGNVMNLAVGVIIGGAFQAIVNSLVNDVVSPVISLATKGINFADKFILLSQPEEGVVVTTVEQAKELGHSFLREVAFLTVHSTLHLLGYDHERSSEEDELQCRIQSEIVKGLEI